MQEKNLNSKEEQTGAAEKTASLAAKRLVAAAIGIAIFAILFDIDVTIKRGALLGKIMAEAPASPAGKARAPAADILDVLEEKVLPPDGFGLAVKWGDLGAKMSSVGVIDAAKFESLYADRGGLDAETKNLFSGASQGNIRITEKNAQVLLNLFWALGLGTRNAILDSGPIADPAYGGIGNFASTGGWTLAKGDAMEHYSRHPFVILTAEQQNLVERVAKNIYRPCCDNPTHFPDCNHGMAMLGLLELMASQGVSENEMYRTALRVNSYWFPDTYITIAKYLENRGTVWDKADPKEILGPNYSSASGYRRILSEVTPPEGKSGGSCGV